MLSILIVALLTILRVGVPLVILLSIGEIIRRKSLVEGNLRGA